MHFQAGIFVPERVHMPLVLADNGRRGIMMCIVCSRRAGKAFLRTAGTITAAFCSRHFSGGVNAGFETEKN